MSDPSLGVAVPDTRLHPVYLLTGTAKTVRQAIPYLVVTIFGGAPWWVNAALFFAIMWIAVAQWHVRKYAVVGGALQVSGGLINRSTQVVPVTRIAVLAASQSFTQRLIGVWKLSVQAPGAGSNAAVTLACLSGHRLDELRAALETTGTTTTHVDPGPYRHLSPVQRYLAWRRTSVGAVPTQGPRVIAVLGTGDAVIAAATNNMIFLIFAAELVAWFGFSDFLPIRAASFMERRVQPHGLTAVLFTFAAVAVIGGVAVGVLRFHRFTLTRDGDVLHTSRGLLAKQAATIPVRRVQAVRVVEGLWRVLFGCCRLEVEVAGVGVTSVDQRLLFPLVRIDRVEALVEEALPELPRPSLPLQALPARVHRRYLTLPLEYAAAFTMLMLFLPGWWVVLAALPVPLASLLGVARAREAGWLLDDRCVALRWRWLLNRYTVIARRSGAQVVALSSSRRKAKAGIAGFEMTFSSGRSATIRYMVDSHALLLLHTVGRDHSRDGCVG